MVGPNPGIHSCARAATAQEARYRIDYPNSKTRASRIIALDEKAGSVIARITGLNWNGARFLTFGSPELRGSDPDAVMRLQDGTETMLSDELMGADVAVMIATEERDPEAPSIIGRACAARGIMTAALVVGNVPDDAVKSLRPYAKMLVIAADEDYVPEMLTALRA